ncbi:hydroxylamine reductase [Desulfurella multipotens]|uniref:Hydroxylamine reductase n=1 Tax=Desulfurella multipotens TaxID=79269 RepID=A0A1G6R8R8_9BACT|nr:hydroxylamine reductase [Desulfurella multipotens]PMP68204.1 MAG: hydroxylamine reductase [Desulfurella multipotens]SDD00427.1 hydroxylamine reductase [Desulfurella multipotens]
MSMFCYQCQEAMHGIGCSVEKGICGKEDHTSDLMDVLIYNLKGLSVIARQAISNGFDPKPIGKFVSESLFMTITNVNFDDERVIEQIKQTNAQAKLLGSFLSSKGKNVSYSNLYEFETKQKALEFSKSIGVLSETNEDIRSLKELIVYGLKGMAAYYDHASVLGFEDESITSFMIDTLAQLTENLSQDELISLVMKTGEFSVKTMELLDKANTSTYGNPEITKVSIGTRNRPGILISGHDLKDMEELLEQTKNTGVDVYTHGEMLPANYYPKFKKYDHFVGNYGNAWWLQTKEFESFNGPILMTTNCLVPPRDSYKDRVFTTGVVGYPGLKHIPDRKDGRPKDFSPIIEMAKKCPPPTQIETGTIVGGFAHNQVLALADKVIEAVNSGAIKRFVVMAGCDGRHNTRKYYTNLAESLPKDTVILTAGCAKYRYNKLNLGDINGIPRVLDAGQCNDSYSLAVIALKLKEAFGLDDINKLPVSYDIAWYEQKAVTVFLALLYLGVKGIRLGPTLPAFLSPNVAKVIVENFDVKPIGEVQQDLELIMQGK